MKRLIRISVLAIIMSLLFVFYANSATINIPADYSTIQAGIDSSSVGDTVLVQPGTYVENINYWGKSITVASLFLSTQDTSYISQTIIVGDSIASVVTFVSGEDFTSVLTGFTITNGQGFGTYPDISGGGITCKNSSSPSIYNVTISDNSAICGGGIYCNWNSSPSLENITITGDSACYGGGIYCNESSPSLENVTITGNSASWGGGIHCSESSPSLENVTITGNSPSWGGGIHCTCINSSSPSLENVTITGDSSYYGGGIYCIESSPSLENVTITGNSASWGGGIYCTYNSSLSLKNITITGNSAYSGGGIYCNESSASLENVTITGNSASYSGGGIYCSGSSPSLENVTITDNSASSEDGGGIYCYSSSSPSLENVTITGNSASRGGGINCTWHSSPSLENITITGNSASYEGSGIWCYRSSPSLVNSIVSDNTGNYGIYVDPGNPTITYSAFFNNENGNFYGCGQWVGVNVTTNANGDSCDAYYNIQLDPLFVNPLNGDYHLSWTNYPIPDYTMSPCIDAGDPNSSPDPDGTIADMGSYYFNQGVAIDEPVQSEGFNLTNYPNPINSNINNLTVSFSINKPGKVKIQLFNVKGQIVSTLINEDKNVGEYTIIKSVNELSSGIYFTRMSIDGFDKEVKKMILLR